MTSDLAPAPRRLLLASGKRAIRAVAAVAIFLTGAIGRAADEEAAKPAATAAGKAPPADSEPGAPFANGWRRTIVLAEPNAKGQASRCTTWVEGGWLVVERRDKSGDMEWQIVLAKIAPRDEPPKIEPTPQVLEGLHLDFRDGLFFIHDDLWDLRCVRQKKTAAERWPVLAIPANAPDSAGGGASNAGARTYYTRTHRNWQFIAGGLGGELAEFVLRMKHPEAEEIRGVSISFDESELVCLRVDGPPEFGGRLPALATVLDDGELLVIHRVLDRDVERERAARLAREELEAQRQRFLGAAPPEISASQWFPRAFGWEELKGKVVLVFYGGDFKRFHNGALRAVEALHERYRDRGFAVVAIVSASKAPAYAESIADRALPFPVAIDDGKTVERFLIRQSPTYFLIGRHGKLLSGRYYDYTRRVDFPLPRTDEIEKLLGLGDEP